MTDEPTPRYFTQTHQECAAALVVVERCLAAMRMQDPSGANPTLLDVHRVGLSAMQQSVRWHSVALANGIGSLGAADV